MTNEVPMTEIMRFLTVGAGGAKLKRCAQKNWHWMSSSACLMTPRCMTSRRKFTPLACGKDWKSWIAARVLTMRRSSASSIHGLQNNLGPPGAAGPQRHRQLYPTRQTAGRATVWRKAHSQSREFMRHAGARSCNSKVFGAGSARDSRSPLPHRIPNTADSSHDRNCTNLARGPRPGGFYPVIIDKVVDPL